jgi:hypothetical protein
MVCATVSSFQTHLPKISNCNQHAASPNAILAGERPHKSIRTVKSFEVQSANLVDDMAFGSLK